jgi:thiol-disulfide isomerase/thioredoxin
MSGRNMTTTRPPFQGLPIPFHLEAIPDSCRGHIAAGSRVTGILPGGSVAVGSCRPGEFARIIFPVGLVMIALFLITSHAAAYTPHIDTTVPLQRLPADTGEHAPDIPLLRATDATTVSLSSFRGKVVYLELWATWCVACYPCMERANESAVRKEWSDKLACVSIALDKETTRVASRVKSRGWDNMVHLVSGPDITGKEFIAVKALGAPMLPYAFLIDADGVIRRRGDPTVVDFESEIAKLLN